MAREKLISMHVVLVILLHHVLISIATDITDIRLVNGVGIFDGRVEILMNGTWGTICSTSFGSYERASICEILFGARTIQILKYHTTSDSYGEGTGPIHIDNLRCTGHEADLNQCTYSLDVTCTDHSRDVAVACNVGYLNITNTRLVNGSGPYDGRIELYVDGKWGSIDRRFIDMYQAKTICNTHGASLAMYFDTAIYGVGTGPILIRHLYCTKEMDTVNSCLLSSPYRPNSSHLFDLSIVCTPCGLPEIYNGDPVAFNGTELTVACHTGFYPTQIKMKCLKNNSWSEEQRCTPYHAFPLNVSDIQLKDNDAAFGGRVEILVNGTWGTICDTNFDFADARVICKMFGLKYNSFRKAYRPKRRFARVSIGSGPIYVNKLNCTGTESHINLCSYEISNHCTHYDDVAVFCTACTSFDNCTTCPSGKYGPSCQHECGLGCQNRTCDITSGNCKCLSNFQGDKCDQCVNGIYLNACDINCPAGCANNSCDINGNCYSCRTGFTGNVCHRCEYGKYGTDCNITCPSGCRNGNCKNNGDCYRCMVGFTRSKCDKCVDGMYGTACEHVCSKNCALGTCIKKKDVCNGGCRINYYGEQCNMTCATTCLQDGEGRRCFDTNGSCVKDCQNGYYGAMCQDSCSENCINSVCLKANGGCKFGCVDGFKGKGCTQSIPGIISDSNNAADSLNIGAFVGGGVGSVAAILLAVGTLIIIRRYLRRGHLSRQAPEQHDLAVSGRIHTHIDFGQASTNVESVIEHGEVSGRRQGQTPSVAAAKGQHGEVSGRK
ncbi:scavenger receptor cysteine-rich type 1 protein M160-like isoform X2 [Mercenaria mercenaria]|uniref:scavenger receptor cysteine-rich type 1 protein M160-like isoform X2 n=1 Tax=Mercenaria mercenaria TaxID=6596 RepID=UPI00234F3447|nr:scavenger receptor cysteine-rich type 1 protein M160-like isoform X2 [Mercenaria mercenaria]